MYNNSEFPREQALVNKMGRYLKKIYHQCNRDKSKFISALKKNKKLELGCDSQYEALYYIAKQL